MLRRRYFDPVLNPLANCPEGLAVDLARPRRFPSRNRAPYGRTLYLA